MAARVGNTFEAAFGKGLTSEERIDFEVTFMTKSYRDGHITIPAYANKDGRAPRSMVLRAQHPEIYDSTVTAQIYREAGPTPHIVEDTAIADYNELYSGQKDRIRSSIIFPVLSDKNEVLGTLVMHCDKRGFFLKREQKYWRDMLEIFAKRIALQKARMDVLVQAKGVIGKTPILVPDAWF
jgi:GAF domain-containing protein